VWGRFMSRNFINMTAAALIAWCATASAQTAGLPVSPPAPPLAPWPTSIPGRMLSSPDWSDYRIYPVAAQRKNAEGVVVSEILIATDGKPIECRIVQSSGSPDLDGGTCDLMMKMRFEPARDTSGSATRSTYRRRLTWLLTDPRPFASSAIEAQVHLEADGSRQCQISGAEGAYSVAWSVVACRFFGETGYYFNTYAVGAHRFVITVRLDAGDQSDFLIRPWPKGKMIAQEKVAFEINKTGDPSGCKAELQWGFGTRGPNNLSPCGPLLSSLWLGDAFQKQGSIETRVYLVGDGQ
jgi:TonB family protein